MSRKWRNWYQDYVDEEIKGVDSRDTVKHEAINHCLVRYYAASSSGKLNASVRRPSVRLSVCPILRWPQRGVRRILNMTHQGPERDAASVHFPPSFTRTNIVVTSRFRHGSVTVMVYLLVSMLAAFELSEESRGWLLSNVSQRSVLTTITLSTNCATLVILSDTDVSILSFYKNLAYL